MSDIGRTFDELEPITIRWRPIGTMHAEREVLLIAGGIHHDGATILHHTDDAIPQTIAHSGTHMTNEHSSGNLQKPPGQIPTKTRGARGQHDHHHKRPPPIVSTFTDQRPSSGKTKHGKTSTGNPNEHANRTCQSDISTGLVIQIDAV